MKLRTCTTHILNIIGTGLARRSGMRLEIGQDSRVAAWRFRSRGAGSLSIGAQSMLLTAVVLERPGASVTIGARSSVGKGVISCAESVEIGDDVLISWDVTILDHASHSLEWEQRKEDATAWLKGEKDWTHIPTKPVHIGNKAWIGHRAVILPGVEIGEGAVIGAGSIVTKNVEPWGLVAGNPAKLIRNLKSDR